ncbi:rhomboid family intramembrane serine protease [Sphingomonas bacterium]|uniref:rhomboid family intramembrane serine protease n=1 Tax=Sphingomonas bacterium TaxID=1895847 RepID=UPI0020C6A3CA|nr:rhomboid family intramembrane serine protease [Sphingomonas bacterium]
MGFIPLRVAATSSPPDHLFWVPAWLTPLTATLVHGGIGHIAFNLVMLAYCGQATEKVVGSVGITMLYVDGAYFAAFGQWVMDPSLVQPMIGASGAISAVVGAYALLFGRRRAAAIGPVSGDVVHIVWLALAWVGIQLLIGFAGIGMGGNIAIGAHIGGFIVGLLLARPLMLWRYRHA